MAGRITGVLLWLTCCCMGCRVDEVVPAPAPAPPVPLSVQIIQAHPELQSQRFNAILNFESPTDTVFLHEIGLNAQADSSRAHTGTSSARLMGRGSFNLRLASLIGSKPLLGEWTMAGGYFFSERPARVSVTCQVGEQTIAQHTTVLPAGKWVGAMVDLAKAARTIQDDALLVFQIEAPGPVWCDDLILIDNTRWLLGSAERPDGWSFVRKGFDYVCTSPGRFEVRLPSVEFDPNGWKPEEVNGMRLRLSSVGPEKSATIYPDGRSCWDGQFRALSADLRSDPIWSQQQISPAQIEIPPAMGRSNRNAAGDRNNDGYDESRGTYPIIASAPRIEVTLVPGSVPVVQPILEISGLPPGLMLVTVEGRLVEQTLRLEDGTLLVPLPLRIERNLTVNLRVQ